jgi:hypothetical protein
MASAIEDVSRLPGETLHSQDGGPIGEIEQVYGVGDGGEPMWITVKASTGLGRTRLLFVPLARVKHEDNEIRVPYSEQHVQGSPEVESGGELSEEDDLALRNYYAIDLADQELRTDNESYAARVPEGDGAAKPIQDEG